MLKYKTQFPTYPYIITLIFFQHCLNQKKNFFIYIKDIWNNAPCLTPYVMHPVSLKSSPNGGLFRLAIDHELMNKN